MSTQIQELSVTFVSLISDAQVEQLLSFEDGIAINEAIFRASAAVEDPAPDISHQILSGAPTKGDSPIVIVPDRILLPVPNQGVTLFKPAYLRYTDEPTANMGASSDRTPDEVLGVKIVSVRQGNAKHNIPTVPATIMLFEPATGFPLALMDATYLTAFRTAAGTAVAGKLAVEAMKRAQQQQISSNRRLLVFGSGLQAEAHIKAFIALNVGINFVCIVARRAEAGQELADTIRGWVETTYGSSRVCQIGYIVSSAQTDAVQRAVATADFIITATASPTPLFPARWLVPTQDEETSAMQSLPDAWPANSPQVVFIASVGSYLPDQRELDTGVVTQALDECASGSLETAAIITDSHNALTAGDFSLPLLEFKRRQRRTQAQDETKHNASKTSTAVAADVPPSTEPVTTTCTEACFPSIVGTLGQCLTSHRETLMSRVNNAKGDKRIVLFKSVGTAMQDMATAHAVYRRFKGYQ